MVILVDHFVIISTSGHIGGLIWPFRKSLISGNGSFDQQKYTNTNTSIYKYTDTNSEDWYVSGCIIIIIMTVLQNQLKEINDCHTLEITLLTAAERLQFLIKVLRLKSGTNELNWSKTYHSSNIRSRKFCLLFLWKYRTLPRQPTTRVSPSSPPNFFC